jgi:sugar lactone lactonase YvrE
MKYSNPEILLDSRAFLGEGPAWDAAREILYWINIFAGELHLYDPKSGSDEVINVGQAPGCAAPCRSGAIILGVKEGIATLDIATQRLTFLSRPETSLPGNRFNDGKCGPDGRFLAGTMDNAEQAATGSLYSLSTGRALKTLLTGVSISNGLAWSPDHKILYFIDTPTRQVVAYDYDLSSGDIANPRVAVSIPAAYGWPDGMTSDANGNLWIAMWAGAALTVWNPSNGALVEKIPVPSLNVTSCAFGGQHLDELYITSAHKGLSQTEISAYPYSGGLFRIKTNITGMPTFVYND